MAIEKYKVGTRVKCGDIFGEVVPNVKLLGDICVQWYVMDSILSYDEEWLDENVEVIE